jgi:hypothetical protein
VANRVPRQNRIKRMFEAGLNIVLGTDDPAMFATTMGHCWRTLFAASKWHVTEAGRRLNGLERARLALGKEAAPLPLEKRGERGDGGRESRLDELPLPLWLLKMQNRSISR